jgi:hypothetical protein
LSEYPLSYTYYPEGKIKSISEGGSMLYNFAYDKNLLTIQKGENIEQLRLDDNGKALGPQIEFKDIDYYYKNDFFISTSENFSIDKTYSANGNLLSFKQKDITGKFEYTDLPNNIRQEVLSPQTFHLSFRDLYLGKFNTNLIKKAEFNLAGENSILDFSYEFDSNNRPIKVTINRNAESGKAVITYELIY